MDLIPIMDEVRVRESKLFGRPSPLLNRVFPNNIPQAQTILVPREHPKLWPLIVVLRFLQSVGDQTYVRSGAQSRSRNGVTGMDEAVTRVATKMRAVPDPPD